VVLLLVIFQKFTNNKIALGNTYIFQVVSESMLPEYKIGDIIVVRKTNPVSLEIGDDVTYLANTTDLHGITITHRIINKREDNGTYYVITNYHVVESYVGSDSAKFYVYVGNTSTRYRASLTAALNSQKDLAVLTINPGRTLKTVSISKDYHPIVSVGENVFAIGCPISLDYFNSVCSGVVSKTEYTATNNNGDLKVIQNTCPINPGNSGGGLFNMAGELIGLNFKKTTYVMEGSSKTLVDGLNYAISLNEVITHLIKYNLI
jgi:signal peptidase I